MYTNRNQTFYRAVVVILFGLCSVQVHAQPAQIGAAIEMRGVCVLTRTDFVENCETTMNVLRFADGFNSFQFKVSAGKRAGATIAFVGSKWGNSETNGAKGHVSENQSFMIIDQVVVLEPAARQQQIKKYPGQCILTFKSKEIREASDLTSVACEYQDGKSGVTASLSNISSININLINDYNLFP